ncbi:MAG: hypothetical protein ABIR96_04800 [Bdellovibrionota bacterium]
MKRLLSIVIFTTLVAPQIHAAALCSKWQNRGPVPLLSAKILRESSGISSSIDFPNQRYYHINDSGSGSAFHVSFENGNPLQSSMVDGVNADDMETIDVGHCPPDLKKATAEKEGCLFLGDIGNNNFNRQNLKFIVVAEKENYKAQTAPKVVIDIDYSRDATGARQHNAEAMMVDPNSGDVYVVTKRTRADGEKGADDDLSPRVYVLKRSVYANVAIAAKNRAQTTLTYVRTIKIEDIFPEAKVATGKERKKFLVTDADFSPDGKTFVLITLGGIVEFDSSILSGNAPIKAEDFSRSAMDVADVLEQQEAITYTSDGTSLVYTSESKDKKAKGLVEARRLICLKR